MAERCFCCRMPIHRAKLTFCFAEKEIMYLGKGGPLFFRFSLLVFFLAMILSLSYSVYFLILNKKGTYCNESNSCSSILLARFSWINASPNSDNYEAIMTIIWGALFIVFCIVMLALKRILLRFKNPPKDYYPV